MLTRVKAFFDGEVLRPETPLDLQPDATYVITIEAVAAAAEVVVPYEEHPLTKIARLATNMGVTDLAENHDRYANRYYLVDDDGT